MTSTFKLSKMTKVESRPKNRKGLVSQRRDICMLVGGGGCRVAPSIQTAFIKLPDFVEPYQVSPLLVVVVSIDFRYLIKINS